MAGLDTGHQQVAVEQHASQKIVEIVGHSAGQTPHGLESLGLTKTLFASQCARKIFSYDEYTVGTIDLPCSPKTPALRLTVVARVLGFDLKALPLTLEQCRNQLFKFRVIFRLDQIHQAKRWCHSRTECQHLFPCGIPCCDIALPVALSPGKRSVVKKRVDLRFGIRLWPSQ